MDDPAQSPVVVPVGRDAVGRLLIASAATAFIGAACVVAIATAGDRVVSLSGLVVGSIGVLMVLVSVGTLRAALRFRTLRLCIGGDGLSWDDGPRGWHLAWDEVASVGVAIDVRGRPIRDDEDLVHDRWIRLLLATADRDAAERQEGLRALRWTADGPIWTHGVVLATRDHHPTAGPVVDRALRRFAGDRYAGTSLRHQWREPGPR